MAVPGQNSSDPLSPPVTDFLTELAYANRLQRTCRAYATDPTQFSAFCRGPVGGFIAEVMRGFGATLQRLRPASRARKQAALAGQDLVHARLVASYARDRANQRRREPGDDPEPSGPQESPDHITICRAVGCDGRCGSAGLAAEAVAIAMSRWSIIF
jgi:hypothetical protein